MRNKWYFIFDWSPKIEPPKWRAILCMSCILVPTALLAGDLAVPSLEFLEFLAEGDELDKQYIDPLTLQEMEDDESVATVPKDISKPVEVKQQ